MKDISRYLIRKFNFKWKGFTWLLIYIILWYYYVNNLISRQQCCQYFLNEHFEEIRKTSTSSFIKELPVSSYVWAPWKLQFPDTICELMFWFPCQIPNRFRRNDFACILCTSLCKLGTYSHLGKTRLQRLLNPISYLGAKCVRTWVCVHLCITSRVVADDDGGGGDAPSSLFRVPRENEEKAGRRQRGTKRNIGLGR